MVNRRCVVRNPARIFWIGFTVVSLLGGSALADQTNDHFLLGYITAVLEQQYKIKAGSLKVQDGVVLINANELSAPDRDKVITHLKGISGVVRVEVIETDSKETHPP